MDCADFKYEVENSVDKGHVLLIIFFNCHQKWKAHHLFTLVANFHFSNFINL